MEWHDLDEVTIQLARWRQHVCTVPTLLQRTALLWEGRNKFNIIDGCKNIKSVLILQICQGYYSFLLLSLYAKRKCGPPESYYAIQSQKVMWSMGKIPGRSTSYYQDLLLIQCTNAASEVCRTFSDIVLLQRETFAHGIQQLDPRRSVKKPGFHCIHELSFYKGFKS